MWKRLKEFKENTNKLTFDWNKYNLIAGLGFTYLLFKLGLFLLAVGSYGKAKSVLVWGMILLFCVAISTSIGKK